MPIEYFSEDDKSTPAPSPKSGIEYFPEEKELPKATASAPASIEKPPDAIPGLSRLGKIGSDLVRGVGYGGAQLADLMTNIAMPKEYMQATGMRPAAAQIYQEHFPAQIVNPKSWIPQAYQIGASVPSALMAPQLGVGNVLARTAIPTATMSAIQEGGEQASSGQFDPKKLALATGAGAVTGPIVHGVMSGLMNIPGAVSNAFKNMGEKQAEEAAQAATQITQPTELASTAIGNIPKISKIRLTPGKPLPGQIEKDVQLPAKIPTEPILNTPVNPMPAGKISKLRKAVLAEKRPNLLARKYRNMLGAKLNEDYYEKAHESVMAKLYKDYHYDSMKPNYNQQLTREELMDMRKNAALQAKIKSNKIVRIPAKNDTIEVTRETPLPKYKPRGKNDKQLIKEANALRLKHEQWEAKYKNEKTLARPHEDLLTGEAESVQHEGHKFIVKRYNKGHWTIKGSPEEIKAYKSNYGKLSLQKRVALAQQNESLRPAWTELTNQIKESDPQLAKEMALSTRGKDAIDVDEYLLNQLEDKGAGRGYYNFIKGLIENDLAVNRALGIGMTAAGQAIAGPSAGAADRNKQITQNRLQVATGVGLMAIGTAMALKPNSLATQFVMQVGDKMMFPIVLAYENAMKAVKGKLPPEVEQAFKGWLNKTLTTAANGDIINSQADPAFAAQFQGLVTRWSKIVSGEGMVLDPSESLEAKQAYARAFFVSNWNQLSKLPLSPLRKQRFWELRNLKKEGENILENEIARLDPEHKGKGGIWGNAGLARILKCELDLNWRSNSPYNKTGLDNIMNFLTYNVVDAFQLFNIGLHAIHVAAGAAEIGGLYPTEYSRAVAALTTRESSAVRFANSVGLKMAIAGNLEDSANPITDKIAKFFDDAMDKATGGLYGKARRMGPPTAIREGMSGRAAERIFKSNIALVAASEKAAIDLNYSSAATLRNDLIHWLAGNEHATSSQFSPEKGLAAMATVNTVISNIGTGPAGYRIGLCIDRNIPQTWARNIFASLSRNHILFNRTLNLQAEGVLNAAEAGDYQAARRFARGFYFTLGLSSLVAGAGVLNKNVHDIIQNSDPVLAQKIHDTLENINIVGHLPGAMGHPELNFQLGHLSSSFFWFTHAPAPALSGTIQSGATVLNPKKTDWQRIMAAANLSSALGWSNLFEAASLQNILRPFRAFQEAAQRGGILEYNFTPEGPYGLFHALKGQTIIPGMEEPKLLSTSRIKMSPMAATLSKILPGQLEAIEDEQENAINEHIAEGIFQQRYPMAHEAVREQLNQLLVQKAAISKARIARGDKEYTPEEWDSLEEEANSPLEIAGVTVTAKTVWKTLLDYENHNRGVFEGQEPSGRYQRRHHIGVYARK